MHAVALSPAYSPAPLCRRGPAGRSEQCAGLERPECTEPSESCPNEWAIPRGPIGPSPSVHRRRLGSEMQRMRRISKSVWSKLVPTVQAAHSAYRPEMCRKHSRTPCARLFARLQGIAARLHGDVCRSTLDSSLEQLFDVLKIKIVHAAMQHPPRTGTVHTRKRYQNPRAALRHERIVYGAAYPVTQPVLVTHWI